MKSYPFDAPDAPLAAVFGDLTPAQRGRLLEQFAKTDKAVSGLVERMRILTDSGWTTGGLTVDDHSGQPRKVSVSAYVADGHALTFDLELVGEPSTWRIYADVSVRTCPDAEPQVALAMEAIDCSTVSNAAIGLTLASGWLHSVIISRPPTAEDWRFDDYS